ncbi:MAG: transcription antitermination factor NusB [Candidatus Improbicoccus pseudotrichonymphae]|uniref:Transcription antitermination protein NusB n=1 Tax=Candidatus Improbicoccus pseudotrichonymphae TaxID=3033792 RepID=A0AA48I116_9FIRM|nr:MAG: transcription antitermination factor NusB [Candidatus Improbicoccus pseudotrichonymphae]
MNRTKARYRIFELLFSYDFNKEGAVREIDEFNIGEENVDFIIETFKGVICNLKEIDNIIENNTRNRKFSRISRVTLAVLRSAIYEIVFSKLTPIGICVSEAVNISKKYSSTDESAYVNAVLSSIEKNNNLGKSN